MHGHAVFRAFEHARDFLAQGKRILATGPNLNLPGARMRDADEGFEVVVRHARKAKLVFEHMVAACEGIGAAGLVREFVADVFARSQHRARPGAIGRHDSGRRGLEQRRKVVSQCCFDASRDRQVGVHHPDHLQCLHGYRFGLRRHRADDVTDIAHSIECDHRLVLDVVAIKRHHVRRNVIAGQHGAHAGHGARSAGIDRHHARVRARTAQQLRMQHAGQVDVRAVEGLAAELGARIAARHRAADLLQGGRDAAHAALPVRSTRAASCTASMISA